MEKIFKNTVIIIQARMGSRRFPGKSIKKIGAYSLVDLVLKRIKNTGLKIVLATSKKRENDILEKLALANNCDVYRGDEDDVRSRFIEILTQLKNFKNVIRLTADNPMPDKFLIREALKIFASKKNVRKYLTTNWLKDNLPYGVSIEVFNRKLFMENCKKDDSSFEKEHVTPKLKKICSKKSFEFQKCDPRFTKINVSIDEEKVYKQVCKMFKNVNDVVNEPWWEIIKKHPDYSSVMNYKITNPEFILGCAQIGTNYGITNKRRNSIQNSKKIIFSSIKRGILEFDTAPVYGNSEKILGEVNNSLYEQNLNINTKLNLQTTQSYVNDTALLLNDIRKSIVNSLKFINSNKINTLFFHDSNLFIYFHKELPKILKKIKQEFEIKKIGVSVYSPKEAEFVINFNLVDVIQIPFNILDYRWKNDIDITNINNVNNIEIQVRSIFLQGLLLEEKIEKFQYKKNIEKINLFLNNFVDKFKRKNKLDLIISYIRGHEFISKVIIGINNSKQLNNFFEVVSNRPLIKKEINQIDSEMPKFDDKFLDPRNW